MYAREHDNKVTVQCNAPTMGNLLQFWTEVQEYMDKGYRYIKDTTMTMMEVPTSMTFIRVTLTKDVTEVKEPVVASEETIKVETTTNKATAKKPAAKK